MLVDDGNGDRSGQHRAREARALHDRFASVRARPMTNASIGSASSARFGRVSIASAAVSPAPTEVARAPRTARTTDTSHQAVAGTSLIGHMSWNRNGGLTRSVPRRHDTSGGSAEPRADHEREPHGQRTEQRHDIEDALGSAHLLERAPSLSADPANTSAPWFRGGRRGGIQTGSASSWRYATVLRRRAARR